MSLLDRLVPASALRWTRLTDQHGQTPSEILERLRANSVVVQLPGGSGVRVTRTLCEDAGLDFDALKASESAPDPAAAWGEADRRAEDRPGLPPESPSTASEPPFGYPSTPETKEGH